MIHLNKHTANLMLLVKSVVLVYLLLFFSGEIMVKAVVFHAEEDYELCEDIEDVGEGDVEEGECMDEESELNKLNLSSEKLINLLKQRSESTIYSEGRSNYRVFQLEIPDPPPEYTVG